MKPWNVTLVLSLVSGFLAGAVATASADTVTFSLGPNVSPSSVIAALHPTIGTVQSCSVPNQNAAVDGTPYFEYPAIASEQEVGGTTAVKIDLAASGSLQQAGVAQSSGNFMLDDSALRTARLTKFAPEKRSCEPIAGSYILTVAFTIGQ
jgi:TonB family protein